MGHDLGDMALPPALPPRRKAWVKTGRTLFDCQKLLLRNLSKRLRGVQEALIPSSPNESFAVTRPLEKDLVLEKNSSLQMEVFSLQEHIDILERQEVTRRSGWELVQNIFCEEFDEDKQGNNRLIYSYSSTTVFVKRKYRIELCMRCELLHEINCCKR
jgi:hypothetical protein